MKNISLLILLSFLTSVNAVEVSSNCNKSVLSKELFNQDVVSPYLGVDGLYHFSQNLYESPKRMPDHFFLEKMTQKIVYKKAGRASMTIPKSFINKLSKLLVKIIDKDYARSLTLADLGHGHFLIPLKAAEELESLNLSYGKSREFVINHPELRILFHSAERLLKVNSLSKPIEDKKSQYYISVRNIVGDLATSEIYTLPHDGTAFNTQSKVEGLKSYWSINFSWNKKGCFKVNTLDKSYFLDFSFSSYRDDPALFVDDSE